MIESFAQLFKESLKSIKIKSGSIISGLVISIDKDVVLVDAGLKSESAIPVEQFKNLNGELEIKVGDTIDVVLDHLEDGYGETILSREKAKRCEAWSILEKAYKKSEIVVGLINGKVKGGFTVELNGIRAFLPGSLVDIHPIKDTIHLEGKELEFKVIKLDQKRNNIVVSRRSVIESENSIERENLLSSLKEGAKLQGIVKNLTDYGAFIDLGGIDGLLHITDMSWKRVKHPNEIVNIGDKINVKVLKFDKERSRVSLGLKQFSEDPWMKIKQRYQEGDKVKGKVTNLTDYGCFVEIESGIEGLVHVSEMDWTNKNIHPSKIVSVNDVLEVMILDIDEERRRISLGLKQCKVNPWKIFSEKYQKNDHVKGKIKSITDFGIFIGLEDGIDGLVHLSDISWNVPGEEAVQKYKKGDEILTTILQIDPDRERISLGIKQLEEDPFYNFISNHKKGFIVNGEIIKINSKGAILKINNSLEGYLYFSDHIDDVTIEKYKKLKIGDTVDVSYVGFDRKNRIILLSSLSFSENIKNKKNGSNLKDEENIYITNNVMVEAFKSAKNE
ncbi:MAG: 30S ribosomal protein S1 [Arsenophonus sp.]|nr:MAG: 30S ribosomal protein S1 [Arsenophonus sp.]